MFASILLAIAQCSEVERKIHDQLFEQDRYIGISKLFFCEIIDGFWLIPSDKILKWFKIHGEKWRVKIMEP